MQHVSSYALCKAALVTRLEGRAGLAGVTKSYQAPEIPAELRAGGSFEIISFDTGAGDVEVVILTGGHLVFDETLALKAHVQVLRGSSLGTQSDADNRCHELLYEFYAELAQQNTWDLVALGLDIFDYFQVIPRGFEFTTGYLAPNGHGAGARLDLEVRSRRSFLA